MALCGIGEVLRSPLVLPAVECGKAALGMARCRPNNVPSIPTQHVLCISCNTVKRNLADSVSLKKQQLFNYHHEKLLSIAQNIV